MLIILDPGHGGTDGGANAPNGALEKNQVLAIALKMKQMESGFGGKVSFVLTRTNDTFVSLEARADMCNKLGAAYFVSIHQNSDSQRAGRGVETYALAPGGQREKLARAIQAQMVAGTGLADRGVKYARYYVLRYTNPPAVLVECGFIGTAVEAAIVTTPDFHEKAALAICRGIASFLGIPFTGGQPAPQPAPAAPLYRVRKTWEDAKSQIGAFHDLNNAKTMADQHRAEGYRVFDDSGNVVYAPTPAPNPAPTPKPTPAPAPVIAKDSIMGDSRATAKQMAAFLLTNNPTPATGLDPVTFCQLYLDEGKAEGVRGDVAFCQAVLETGYFRFNEDVKPEQHNYAGIGATGNGVAGASFPDQRTGIRAQIQHLKAYASTEALKNPVVDPRFSLVTRGSAPNWQDLAGKWAVPGYDTGKYLSLEAALIAGETYGQDIMRLYEALMQTKELTPDPAVAAIDELKRLGLLEHEVEPGQAVTWGELAQLVVKLK